MEKILHMLKYFNKMHHNNLQPNSMSSLGGIFGILEITNISLLKSEIVSVKLIGTFSMFFFNRIRTMSERYK